MKRHLKNDRYSLTDLERERVWQGIRTGLKGGSAGDPSTVSRTSFRPAFGLAAAIALIVVVGGWWVGNRPGEQDHLAAGPTDVARLKSEEAPAGQEPFEVALAEESVLEKEAVSGDEGRKGAGEPAPAKAADSPAPSSAPAPSSPRTATAEKAPRPPAALTLAASARQGRAGLVNLTGRLRDRDTGEAVPHASVLVRGTNLAAFADSTGAFTIAGLEPGAVITLQVSILGYDRMEQELVVPDTGPFEVALDLQPMVVATLQPYDVEGAEYMVEVRGAVKEPSSRSRENDRQAIDSPDQALSKMAGVARREGELHVRGGRSGEVKFRIDGAAPPASAPVRPEGIMGGGSVTGGTKPPNGEQVELMYFDHTGVNPFVAAEDDSLSTFALDVDTASWSVARNYLQRGMLPPKEAIRVEEFVNAFDPGWPAHTDADFRIYTDGGASRFGRGYHLLRIGLVGRTVDASARKPANLVFVIDVSGSMNRENRLGAVKKALHVLLGEMREGDTVGIVIYGSQGQVRLAPTDVSQRETIAAAIDGLAPGGSTNVYEGLALAYNMARGNFDPGKINRLILCSDGVANNGMSTEAEKILELVRTAADESITISAIGFGMGNYNDVLMEKLANKGDGNYYYVDRHEEAERVFRENLTGLLQTIAREAKVQVAFDPDAVDRWRLLGYENRDVADRDFRNDAVDAGEVGAGHQVTALYELKLKDDAAEDAGSVGTVRLRWEAPAHDTARAGEVTEIDAPVTFDQFAGDFGSGSAWRRAQTLAAEFAEILRESYWARESRLEELIPLAEQLKKELPGDAAVSDLAAMIRRAADLKAAGEKED